MPSTEKSKSVFSTTILTVFAIILSGCSIEPKPTKAEIIQSVLEEVRLIGSSLSAEKRPDAIVSFERSSSLFNQLNKSKEDKKSTSQRACNIIMAGDLRDIHRLYKYALSIDQFSGERHAIGTIRGTSISKYGDCAYTEEIYQESKIAKSLLLQHLDSVFPNYGETFEERYTRIVGIQRIRETEAFTAWYSMDDTEKETFEASASVRACLDAATEEGATGITLSDLQSACRQGLR